jgi:hypothetical protein
MLTSAFTRIADAITSTDQTSDHLIVSTDNKISIDITGMLNTWTVSPALNYGILFKSLTAGSSPAQIVLALPDSIGITFTTIPEVK